MLVKMAARGITKHNKKFRILFLNLFVVIKELMQSTGRYEKENRSACYLWVVLFGCTKIKF